MSFLLCESCETNEKVGDWDCCYECQKEHMNICPKCYGKVYGDYCDGCYREFRTCNICYEEDDDLNCLNICDECVKSRLQECLALVNRILC